jgi:putative transposase
MAQKRKTHSDEFKARVAMEAIKGVRTLSELSAVHGVHPTVIAHWKRQLVEGAAEVFRCGPAGGGRSEETVTAPLYQETCLPAGRTALIWKLLHVAEGHFRRLNAPELLPLVYAGIQFVDGIQKPITPKETAA